MATQEELKAQQQQVAATALSGGPAIEPDDEATNQGDAPVTGSAPSTGQTPGLSNQQGTLQKGLDTQEGILGGGLENLQGYETGRDTSYDSVDSAALQEQAAIKEGGSFITPEATVQGQLEGLLASDSAYMQNAKKQAEEFAASKGLLGSSMAAGATQRAAIEAGLPIAQADAKTYATAVLSEQKTYNEIASKQAESELSAAARQHSYNLDTAKAETNAAFSSIMNTMKNQGNMAMETTLGEIQGQWEIESQTTLKQLDSQLALLEGEQQISGQLKVQAQQQAAQVMAASYGTINELLQNADFMAGFKDNPAKLTATFNNFINMAKQEVKFIGATAGLANNYTGWTNYMGGWTTNMSGYKPTA